MSASDGPHVERAPLEIIVPLELEGPSEVGIPLEVVIIHVAIAEIHVMV